jgi:ABC-type Fe3+ transport system substrate-binding protein
MVRTRGFLAVIATLTLLAGSVAACGSDSESSDGAQQTVASRDELLRLANEEGALHVQLSPPDEDDFQSLLDGFMKKYSGIKASGDNLGGAGNRERYLLEVEGGAGRNVDVGLAGLESIDRIEGYMDTWNVREVAEKGVLNIPVDMIDPETNGIVAQVSSAAAVIYNTDLIKEADLPNDWFGFTDKRFSRENLGLVANVEFQNDAVLVPALGEDKTFEYAKGIAALNPIYVDSQNTGAQLVVQGEAAVYPLINAHTANLVVKKAQAGGKNNVAVKYIQPIPIRLTELNGVMDFAAHPHAGLLWLEYLASDEVQAMWDKFAPPQTSIYSPYDSPTSMKTLADGKATSIVDWSHIRKYPGYVDGIIEAHGFPKAQK